MKTCVIGLDYGTDSVRAILIDTANGNELTSEVYWYPRWKDQKYCDPKINQFRQHPTDHIEGLEHTIKAVIRQSAVPTEAIVGICVDTTGSTPLPMTSDGVPLALTPEFADNPNAMMVLWKDHTSIQEADEINQQAKNWGGEDFTKYVGGIYSSEWFWAKILHVIREDEQVAKAAYTWMEHCDYMTYLLSDNKDLQTFKRSRCAAGHKAMWHESWNGLPSETFLSKLHPYLGHLKNRLYQKTYTSDQIAGHLNQEWAEKLGLTENTVVAVGTFDAHAGAVGAKIEHNTLVRVMGTSTCDIMISPADVFGEKTINGICGQVDGSVISGYIGLEAGQSAFGDLLAWFKNVLSWSVDHLVMTSDILSDQQKQDLRIELEANFIAKLTEQAEQIPLSEAIPIALDWVNGRRTPNANQTLKSAISGLSLGTKAAHIFKALVNAICFGSKNIVEHFQKQGVQIDRIIGIGGVAKKSPFIMQTLANVLNMPVKVATSDQAPALGAAIYAATAAGVYKDVITAAQAMGSDYEAEYFPQANTIDDYALSYNAYKQLGSFIETQLSSKI